MNLTKNGFIFLRDHRLFCKLRLFFSSFLCISLSFFLQEFCSRCSRKAVIVPFLRQNIRNNIVEIGVPPVTIGFSLPTKLINDTLSELMSLDSARR